MILITEKNNDYELIDSGQGKEGGEKLERFGKYIIRRPDPEVLWKKMKSDDMWNKADAYFTHAEKSGWKTTPKMENTWVIEIAGLKALLRIQSFKHVGFFPEQISQWQWMRDRVTSYETRDTNKKIKVLNLFGYTGLASVALAQAGAEVTHVDALKQNIAWAKENAALNSISNIRFIIDDARKFVEKEIRRGATYDAILMDPPVYGKGAKREQWHIEKDFLPLLSRSAELLSDSPLFFVVNGYASEYSHLSYANALNGVFPKTAIESGELALKESDSNRLLPAGIFARASF